MCEYPFVLVVGGARSGKSRYAETLAARSGAAVTYLATAGPPRDAEMAERIATHQARRPPEWSTREITVSIAETVRQARGVLLVDCMTLWLTNLVLSERNVAGETETLLDAIAARQAAIVAISNEVGEGIVPATALGRAFRDQQGVLNQRLASAASTVVKMVAGCPLIVKPTSQPELTL
ncbi:bifunctional adenosylcobinamide kinase/adenosylcobinamide-phosphate guanylyltransferase [Acuticoccus sp. M5D2P5]|uniref:bifunctional adenosylcobinamide kinase/adenosylcobinamide-phosphate guanylyltransferase n=1 Tax=Acuticoccus kalidii TaxID=2910977 RepID=UPI001F479687|nr:bifunctional adenosylcobinamide kinase/adenosylcobinamide-phosphate guanylyltransferase [Acuticoccus kalidii]